MFFAGVHEPGHIPCQPSQRMLQPVQKPQPDVPKKPDSPGQSIPVHANETQLKSIGSGPGSTGDQSPGAADLGGEAERFDTIFAEVSKVFTDHGRNIASLRQSPVAPSPSPASRAMPPCIGAPSPVASAHLPRTPIDISQSRRSSTMPALSSPSVGWAIQTHVHQLPKLICCFPVPTK